jgi:hypothetical protein
VRHQTIASCGFATRTTSCPGHPRRAKRRLRPVYPGERGQDRVLHRARLGGGFVSRRRAEPNGPCDPSIQGERNDRRELSGAKPGRLGSFLTRASRVLHGARLAGGVGLVPHAPSRDLHGARPDGGGIGWLVAESSTPRFFRDPESLGISPQPTRHTRPVPLRESAHRRGARCPRCPGGATHLRPSSSRRPAWSYVQVAQRREVWASSGRNPRCDTRRSPLVASPPGQQVVRATRERLVEPVASPWTIPMSGP